MQTLHSPPPPGVTCNQETPPSHQCNASLFHKPELTRQPMKSSASGVICVPNSYSDRPYALRLLSASSIQEHEMSRTDTSPVRTRKRHARALSPTETWAGSSLRTLGTVLHPGDSDFSTQPGSEAWDGFRSPLPVCDLLLMNGPEFPSSTSLGIGWCLRY